MSRILCVDDEPAILRLLGMVLARDGHQILPCADARAALAAARGEGCDAAIVDLGLPDRDGLELVSALVALGPIPVIVLTARSEVADKVTALDLGACDYVTKPFDGDELLARLRGALRRAGSAVAVGGVLSWGPLTLDLAHHALRRAGERVALTPREFAVLRLLIEAGGRIVTHAALLEGVWGKAHRDDIEYLRVVIRALRLKLELDPSSPQLILNEPAVGYRLG
jgi:two-component system KDP operon response regulator KdpE